MGSARACSGSPAPSRCARAQLSPVCTAVRTLPCGISLTLCFIQGPLLSTCTCDSGPQKEFISPGKKGLGRKTFSTEASTLAPAAAGRLIPGLGRVSK